MGRVFKDKTCILHTKRTSGMKNHYVSIIYYLEIQNDNQTKSCCQDEVGNSEGKQRTIICLKPCRAI